MRELQHQRCHDTNDHANDETAEEDEQEDADTLKHRQNGKGTSLRSSFGNGFWIHLVLLRCLE